MPTILEQNIEAMITPAIEDLGYHVVRVKLMEKETQTLQIMAERPADRQLNVDDCAAISRTVSALLDVEDPISGEYNLEVSSPGVDRPLVKAQDFIDYQGHEIKLNTHHLIEERKRFSGTITAATETELSLKAKEGDTIWQIPLEAVDSAKLVITDALLKTFKKEIANHG